MPPKAKKPAAKKPAAKKPAAKKAIAKKPAAKKEKKEKKDKVPRAPSAYNLFMKSELAKIKKANPKMEHKEAFTKAAKNWSANKK
jgi:histone H1/5